MFAGCQFYAVAVTKESLGEGFAVIINEIREDFARLEQRVDVLAERIDVISDADDDEEEIDLALELSDLRQEIKKLRKALTSSRVIRQ